MIPFNRHLLVEPITEEEKKEQAMVLVPDDYRPAPRHARVKVIEKAEDCKIPVFSGAIVIVNSSMIEEVTVGEEVYSLILENHILGRVED
jgi:co-chaperonin GroES (HSP10)